MGGVLIRKIGRCGGYDRCGRYGGYDALKNPPHVVRLDEQSKDPKRSPESPQPMTPITPCQTRVQILRAIGVAIVNKR